MQLNITTDYGVRICLLLASSARPMTSKELSEAARVSNKYVTVLIKKLKDAGLVLSSLGILGGYLLAKEPEKISLFDIIVAMEGAPTINRCLEPDHFCSRGAAETCPVRKTYLSIQDNLYQQLKEITIAGLLAG